MVTMGIITLGFISKSQGVWSIILSLNTSTLSSIERTVHYDQFYGLINPTADYASWINKYGNEFLWAQVSSSTFIAIVKVNLFCKFQVK